MKEALVLLAALGFLACCDAEPYPPRVQCPSFCLPMPRFACAVDKHGNVYRFLNYCHLQKCACKMRLVEVPMSHCPVGTGGCPMKDMSVEIEAGVGGDSSAQQDRSDDSQSDDSQSGDSQSSPQSASADSLEAAHLQHNAVRNNRRD